MAGLALLVAACGGPGGGGEADRATVARAIHSADQAGGHVDFTLTMVLSGGEIPAGKVVRVGLRAAGTARSGAADMKLTTLDGAGKAVHVFDMRLVGDTIYLRPKSAEGWASVPAQPETVFFAALRLELVREAVLLGRSVSAGSLERTDSGIGHRYHAVAGPDQVEQFLSATVAGGDEAAFLKTASASIDAHLGVPGDRLNRLEVHSAGLVGGLRLDVRSATTLRQASAPAVDAPAVATPIPPAQLLDFLFA